MNLRRETGVSLATRHGSDSVQIHLSQFGYIDPKPEPEGDPVAQCLAQFSLAPSQRLVFGPYSLEAGDLAQDVPSSSTIPYFLAISIATSR